MVTTDARDAKAINLGVSFNVVTAIQVNPNNGIFISAVEGSPSHGKVLLHRTDNKPLLIHKLEQQEPKLVEARFHAVKTSDSSSGTGKPGDVVIDVSLAPQAKASSHSTHLTVHTNHPEQPVLQVPVTVRIRRLIEARPVRLTLWASDDTRRSVNFQLVHNGGKLFEINHIESSHPGLFGAEKLSPDSSQTHTIQVELADGIKKSNVKLPVQGKVKITSSDPNARAIEVPVIVAERKARARRPTQK